MRQLPKGATKLVKTALGKRARVYNLLVNRWLHSSGEEWTVSRLKAIRTGIYQLRAGNTIRAKEIWQENSISYNHKSLIPKGIFGFIAEKYLHSQQGNVIRNYDAVLRVYTCIHMEYLTRKQMTKAKNAINLPLSEEAIAFVPDFCKIFERYTENIFKCMRHWNESHFNDDFKLTIDMSLLSPSSRTHSEGIHDKDIESLPWGKHVESLWTSCFLPEPLQKLNPASKLYNELVRSGADNTIAGHIAFIQEGGCKARVVAVPNVWIQLHMRWLDDYLDRIIKKLPESCSHEQNKGAYFMSQTLRQGGKLYCFDLSSATDRFPIELQLAVLRSLGLDMFADAVNQISKAPWRVSTNLEGTPIDEVWSYQCGQPMGMYASFKLFHLTHYMLLRYLSLTCKVKDSFRVLGDDVIINDHTLAHKYYLVMTKLGLEISPTKSVISRNIGEFAGFVAIRTNKSAAVHRPFKYSGRQGFGACLPMLYSFGHKVSRISDWYRDRYEMFSNTLGWRHPDLSPLIPQEQDFGSGMRLNSHLLGSMSNRLSYYLGYVPTDNLLDCYEEQQIILLGQKEKVNAEGFASASDNVEISPGRDLDIQDSTPEYGIWDRQLSSDPLMKEQIKLRRSTAFDRNARSTSK